MVSEEPRLSPGKATLWVLLAGALAQIAGAFVSSLMRVWVAGSAAAGSDAALATAPAVMVPALVASACALLAVVALVPPLYGISFRSALGLWPASPVVFVAGAVGTVMLSPTADALMRTMDALFPTWTLGVVPLLDRLVAEGSLWWVVPVFALLPGVSEELLFRGILQRALGAGALAIVASGVGFALFHVDPHHVVGVLPLGLFLAWVGARAGTLVTVVAHAANNAVAIAAAQSQVLQLGYREEQPMPAHWVPLSLLVVGVCAWIIRRRTSPAVQPGATERGDSARTPDVR